jgi:hypothetical protein
MPTALGMKKCLTNPTLFLARPVFLYNIKLGAHVIKNVQVK